MPGVQQQDMIVDMSGDASRNVSGVVGGDVGRNGNQGCSDVVQCLLPHILGQHLLLICPRNVDRPELCQVSLYDFQKFLLHDQKVGCPLRPLSVPDLVNPLGHPFPLLHLIKGAVFAPQEPWASDVGMVRDYMCSYLKDGSVDAAEPSFQLDEVSEPVQH